MQSIMTQFGYDQKIFPCHCCISGEQTNLVSHSTKETFLTEKMYLNMNAEQRNSVSVLVVKDLNRYIKSIVMDLEQGGELQFDSFNDYLWLLFSGNKGETLMTLHFEVINSKDAGSVYNVHIYAMYEGSDCCHDFGSAKSFCRY